MTEVANPHRGEIVVKLDADYVIRPDFEAVAAIDEQLGSVLDVARRAIASSSVSFREACVVICEGMRAQGRKTNSQTMQAVNLQRVQSLVYDVGIITVMGPVVEFLGAAITGGATLGNTETAETAKT